jgi:hypothetical protein
MISDTWKYIFASVLGTSHNNTDIPCQDKSACRVLSCASDSSVLVAVVADGAGSAQRAEIGASLACSLFIDEMIALFECGGTVRNVTREFAERWVTRFHNEVTLRAEVEGLKLRDFACTFLAAVVGSDCAAFLQVGDGAIVISTHEEPDFYGWVFWPQQGMYANLTNFATDTDVFDKLEYALVNQSIEEIAVFTDGLQKLTLHYETRTAYAPFFSPVFKWLCLAPEDYSEKFSSSLISYLNSQKINEYTDDDKTIIFATRRLITEMPDSTE